jgi:hypothetical protein
MKRKPITIAFLGDIGLNDGYREDFAAGKKPFSRIAPVLAENDWVVGNLEVVCQGSEGENLLKVPRLKTDEGTLHYLLDLNLDLVTLAGNHVYDNLEDGFQRTVDTLGRMGIAYTGAAVAGSKENECFVADVGGFKLAFLNYLHLDTHPHLPENSPVAVNLYHEERIVHAVSEAKKQVDFVFLILHWGVDNSFFPSPGQRSVAKRFVEAGADCIVGHHSHTLQGYETIDGHFIFYSLGNFCFSDFTSEGRLYQWDRKRHLHSVVLRIRVSDEGLRCEPVPIEIREREVTPGGPANHLKRVSWWLPVVSSPVGWRLYLIYLLGIYKLYFFFFGNGRRPFQRLRAMNGAKVNRFLKQLIKGVKRSE